jgi:hypothetical protein
MVARMPVSTPRMIPKLPIVLLHPKNWSIEQEKKRKMGEILAQHRNPSLRSSSQLRAEAAYRIPSPWGIQFDPSWEL